MIPRFSNCHCLSNAAGTLIPGKILSQEVPSPFGDDRLSNEQGERKLQQYRLSSSRQIS